MKFAHIADCHIGGWRDPKLSILPSKAFEIAVDRCINNEIDFMLISGDLFNTSIPGIDKIKHTTKQLKRLKDNNIPVYLIAGSHDFSPSGKTMLDVLEEAGLCINVVKGQITEFKLQLNFTTDKKTGAKITGLLGLRNMLETVHYKNLILDNLEKEEGFKIFMFHTALTELKPKKLEKMPSSPISLLPKTFDYYAGGHVHIVEHQNLEGYKNVIYPGPLFPNSFSELQDLGNGGFYVYNNGEIKREEIMLHPVINILLDCNHKEANVIETELIELLNQKIENGIILIKLIGTLISGRISDINFSEIFHHAYSNGAYFIMKNTSGLKTKDFEEIKIDTSSVEEIENSLIQEHLGQIKSDFNDEQQITTSLMSLLNKDRDEGEKVGDFEDRLREEVDNLLELE